MKKEDKDKHCHYSGLPSPSAYAKDDIDYDGMGNQGRVPNKKEKMRHREEIVLMWIILVITWFRSNSILSPYFTSWYSFICINYTV